MADVKLTFEELTNVLEACPNRQTLDRFSCDNNGFEVLMSGHFLMDDYWNCSQIHPSLTVHFLSCADGICVNPLFDTYSGDSIRLSI